MLAIPALLVRSTSPPGRTAWATALCVAALSSACASNRSTDAVARDSAGIGAIPPAADGGRSAAPDPIPVAGGFDNSATPPSTGGVAGSTPIAVTNADSGVKPRSDLDPNVVFDWQQTAPGVPNSDVCQAGVYTGTFKCTFIGDPSVFGGSTGGAGGATGPGFTLDVSGPISLQLAQSTDGEFLEIADGQFSAIAVLFFGFRAQLKGKLDCKTLQLVAMTEGGMWALGDPNMPLIPGGTFGANLEGTLDPQTRALTGVWSFTTGTIPGTCTGQWNAAYTP